MALLILYVLLAIVISFLCSIMEAVLLSVTPSYMEMKVREGSRPARVLYDLRSDIDRPLAAILSLNTVAHTVGAAAAGAQAANVFGDAAVGIFSGILTLLILILSEIIPKTLGAVYWRQLANPVTSLLLPTIWITWPLVKLSLGMTRLLSPAGRSDSISREEITAMAELGKEQGLLDASESRIIRNLFRFSSLRVKDIMTPRIVVFALSESLSVREVVSEYEEFRFSRIPVYTESRDDVTGYVLKDEILLRAAQDRGDITLGELKRDVLVVPDALPLHELFERMLDGLEHIALVVDEYGGVAGVVSMEDVVETLLGLEIVDEADSAEDMQLLARRQWLARARRLGIVPHGLEETDDDQLAAFLQFGITGGALPGESPDENAESNERSMKVEDRE
jgi:CBS domain containing-hemolysin-like protein